MSLCSFPLLLKFPFGFGLKHGSEGRMFQQYDMLPSHEYDYRNFDYLMNKGVNSTQIKAEKNLKSEPQI